MDLKQILLGKHKASSLAGIVMSWAYAWLGTDMPITNPKVLIPSLLIYLGGRFFGETAVQPDGPRERNTAAPSPFELQAASEVARFRSRIVELERECERLHTAWHNAVSENQAQIIAVPSASKPGVFLSLLLAGFLLLSQAACGSQDVDQMLAWSDRASAYTDTARSLILDFYCEDCPVHKITLNQSLMSLRALQGLHNANGEIYRTLRGAMNDDRTVITLDAKKKAYIDGQVPLLKDKLNYYARDLPDESKKRLQVTNKILTEAVNQFAGSIARAPVNDKGVVVISLTPEQARKFDQQYARMQKISDDLEAAIYE